MKPNVLLIVLDSVRARNTSIHGHVNETTPFLERFVSEGATQYKQARAPGSRSITSHASIFTGLHVNEHRVTSADTRLKEGTTVFERLRDKHGYDTGVFSENVWITEVDIGLKRGFDTVVGPQDIPYPDALNPRTFVAEEGRGEFVDYLKDCLEDDQTLKGVANGVFTKISSDYPYLLPGFVDASSPGNLFADKFLNWVEGRDRWAACVNLMDAHLPYNPKDDFNRWGDDLLREIEEEAADKWELNCTDTGWWRQEARESLYDGTILQADSYVERIVEKLDDRGVLEDTLVVVTSDHGEGFGETGEVRPIRVAEHNVSTHEVVLHVPLVVKYPGQTETEVIDSISTLARFPNVVEEAVQGGASPGAFVPDRPVVASTYGLAKDEQLQSRALTFCEEEELDVFDGTSRVVYEDEGDIVRKYVKWRDQEATLEVRNAQISYRVSDDGGDKVSEVFGEMDETGVREEGEGMDSVDDSTYDRLEDLGYV